MLNYLGQKREWNTISHVVVIVELWIFYTCGLDCGWGWLGCDTWPDVDILGPLTGLSVGPICQAGWLMSLRVRGLDPVTDQTRLTQPWRLGGTGGPEFLSVPTSLTTTLWTAQTQPFPPGLYEDHNSLCWNIFYFSGVKYFYQSIEIWWRVRQCQWHPPG